MTDEQEIRKVITTWMEATKKGDTLAVLELMTDDVVFLVAGREPFGKEAFRAASHAQKDTEVDGTSAIVELRVLGDHAYVRSHLAVTMRMGDGKVVERAGPVLTVFRKEGGKWKLARDANLLTEKNST